MIIPSQAQLPPPICRKALRDSNLELLRIVSMLLVLLIHYVPSRLTPTPETIRTDFWSVCLNLELRSIAFVCVNCFILISGYFGIKWKFRSISGLLFQILFYGGIAWLIGYFAQYHGLGDHVNLEANPIHATFTERWFISAYLVLYLFAPILNKFIDDCDKQRLGRFIIVFYVVSTLYGYLLLDEEFNEGMSMVSLAGLYLIGAYIRRYKIPVFSLPASYDLLIYLGIGVFLVLTSIVTLYLGIRKSVYGYLDPFIIIQAIYLFLFFSKIKVKASKPINLVAASAFSIYCLHHHSYVYGLYVYGCEIINQHPSVSLLLALIYFAAIYMLCVCLDPLRKLLFKWLCQSLAFMLHMFSSIRSKRFKTPFA